MATVEQIIDQARELSSDDQRRLRTALEALDLEAERQSALKKNIKERNWIRQHRHEYVGEWVALDGNSLIAHGPDARQVYLAAREAGIDTPYVDRIEIVEEAFMGGWQ